jgi:transposase-like protein
MQRAGPELVADSQIEQGRQAFRERYEAYQQAKEPTVVPEPKQEQALEKNPEKALEKEVEIKHDRGFGIGM